MGRVWELPSRFIPSSHWPPVLVIAVAVAAVLYGQEAAQVRLALEIQGFAGSPIHVLLAERAAVNVSFNEMDRRSGDLVSQPMPVDFSRCMGSFVIKARKSTENSSSSVSRFPISGWKLLANLIPYGGPM